MGYLGLAGVDPDQCSLVPLRERFANVANAGDRRACTALDSHGPARPDFAPPDTMPRFLNARPLVIPVRVAEHQDIRPRQAVAAGAAWQRRVGSHRVFVDRDLLIGRIEDPDPALIEALHRPDGAMAFHDPGWVEPSLLELAVHVGCEHEPALIHPLGPASQHGKPGVGSGLAIEVEPVAVEAPCQRGIFIKPARIGDGGEFQAERLVAWVGTPEPLSSPEVRQSRIDPHAGPRANQQGVGRGNDRRGTFDSILVSHGGLLSVAVSKMSREATGHLKGVAAVRVFVILDPGGSEWKSDFHPPHSGSLVRKPDGPRLKRKRNGYR